MTPLSAVIDLADFDEEKFVTTFGALYEKSPWIARQTWSILQSASLENNGTTITAEKLATTLKLTVDQAPQECQLELLRAHPELAGRAATEGKLTAESTSEQASARLDRCSAEEYEKFQRLNAEYNEKFGFPFIMAVRKSSRVDILDAFESRLHNSEILEFETAVKNVHQIALYRLEVLAEQAGDGLSIRGAC